jgi:hypothetical protein
MSVGLSEARLAKHPTALGGGTTISGISEQVANDYRAWLGCADSLVLSARLLRENRTQLEGQHLDAFTAWGPELLLWGSAVELLLKALHLKRVGPLHKGGRYKGGTDHDLEELAREAGYPSRPDEAELLKRLTPLVQRAGRYPWPTTLPRPEADGPFWNRTWDVELDALVESIRAKLDF